MLRGRGVLGVLVSYLCWCLGFLNSWLSVLFESVSSLLGFRFLRFLFCWGFRDSWFIGVLVSWFLGFKVSWFLGLKDSKILNVFARVRYHLTKSPFHVFW